MGVEVVGRVVEPSIPIFGLIPCVKFLIQAIALGAMLAFPTRLLLSLACMGVGLTVGKMTSLSAPIVYHARPEECFGTVIS
jgi:hypothetical protein